MDRTVLANRLVDIAKDLADMRQAGDRSDVIVAMAKVINAYNMDNEVGAMKTQVSALVKLYKNTAAKMISEKNAAEEAFKKADEVLTAYTKEWRKQSGYDKVRTQLLEQAQQCLNVGEMLEGLEEDLTVVKRVSEKPAYEVAWSVLVATLNEAELKKFVTRLEGAYQKLFVELKTGVKDLDKVVKEWSEDAKNIAEERGIKLPRASVTAGAVDGFLDVLKGIIPNLISGIKSWGTRLWTAISGQTSQIDSLTDSLMSKVSKARAILAE